VLHGAAVPAIQPVSIPGIDSLVNGTISVTSGNHSIPLELKVSFLICPACLSGTTALPLELKMYFALHAFVMFERLVQTRSCSQRPVKWWELEVKIFKTTIA
jgi:hypothetical protein